MNIWSGQMLLLTSTMIVQKDSLYEVVERCNQNTIPIIAGGPTSNFLL